MEKFEIYTGIGCGKEEIHSRELPIIDTILYLGRASDLKNNLRIDGKGAILIADINVDPNLVSYREKVVKKILQLIDKGSQWETIHQTKIRPKGSDGNSHYEGYAKEEAKDAELILTGEKKFKIGWKLGSDKDKKTGEAGFDNIISNQNLGISFIYTPPGITLRGGKKCPYSLKIADLEVRISSHEEYSSEVAKVNKSPNLNHLWLANINEVYWRMRSQYPNPDKSPTEIVDEILSTYHKI